MKIGILTLPFNNNYGGYLQAYALMTVLKNEGHDVELIYRRHNKPPFRKLIIPTCKNVVKKLLGRKVLSIIPNPEKEFRARGASMMPFLDKYIVPRSKPLYSSKEFTKYVSGRYDAVIVGSDQVWRPDYGPHIQDFFFADVKDKELTRFSYAASFGNDNPAFTEKEVRVCGEAVKKFKAVSVREDTGLKVFEKFDWKLDTEVRVVLDPTFLLSKDDYNTLLLHTKDNSKGKLFSYVLNKTSEKNKIVDYLIKEIGVEEYSISNIQSENSFLPSVEEWLIAIRDAVFVVTDSFHGMVFSVIFNKPFIVVPNKQRGYTRFSDFLNGVGLPNRIVEDVNTTKDVLKKEIDFQLLNIKLNALRTSSLAFINSQIKQDEEQTK